MEKNVGKTDKIIRIIVAVIAAYLGYAISPWFYILTAMGLITAATGMCYAYVPFKINTCEACKSKKS